MSDWVFDDVITNGIKLHYHRTGGNKPPLVLSHGITDSGLCWLRAAQVLEKDYDLIMVDARGHGLSEAPSSGYSVEHRAADLAGLIQALGLEKPALMGHSMGADTTAMVAATYPELVGCAVLEDPPWREAQGESEEVQKARTEQWRTTILERREKTPEELREAGRLVNPKWAEIEFGPWSEAKGRVSPHIIEAVSAPRQPWRETVARITCPTLLVTGDPELGGIVTPEVAQEISETRPNIKVAHISQAGHNIRREQFEKFVEVVTAFLKENYR